MRLTLPTLLLFLTCLPADAAEIHADGTSCTLADAIVATNTDAATGGCPQGDGADTIVLDADVTLVTSDSGSTEVGGAAAGLPDVTSELTIRAGLGSLIQREPSFGCEDGEADPVFRLLNVLTGGSLRIEDVEIAHGCVTSPADVFGLGGAIYSSGGALALYGAIVRDSTVRGASSVRGGGIYVLQAGVELVDSQVEGNLVATAGASARAQGGGICVLLADSVA